ncbi:hypothetical protein IFT72_14170 [Frigoribacterium sp. CFBP 8754]|jgi:hypothetical protein|uniref:hypothetical protein n=1 Tax=unclassified Frigoribacterium TaxID=2627005 RepID=UPI001782AD70|nr:MULTISPECIES: hypothetical protein [unclassified Frigoribacterium]MBD8661332.1 hypothetical protein [Frigoribacterium sp. CFBP 8754]MBD8729485.1 hypothetical protein [Frigoribacterium sp. CFBP 13707]
MSSAVGERRPALRRWPFVAIWGGAALLVVIGFVVTVSALNATLYGAAGFARGYLDAVDRGDTSSALTLAGVEQTDELEDSLLDVPSLGGLEDVHEVSQLSLGDGTRTVTLGYTLDGVEGQSQFVLTRAGTRFGVFQAWRFAQPPTAILSVTPEHDPRFTVDGRVVTTAGGDVATRFTVLAPSRFELSHESTWLEAPTVEASVLGVGSTSSATVATVARASFAEELQGQLDDQLDDTCVTQSVLLPAGCPFGRQVDDRVTSDPVWSMVEHPQLAVVPSATPSQWLVQETPGTAHLVVEAQSLFDGRRYTIDEDVPFTVSYQMTIGTDDQITFQ